MLTLRTVNTKNQKDVLNSVDISNVLLDYWKIDLLILNLHTLLLLEDTHIQRAFQ